MLPCPIEVGHFTVMTAFKIVRHHSIHQKLRTGVKGRGKGEHEFTASRGTFCVLQNVDDMGKVKGSCDVQETQFLCGLAIELIVRFFAHVQESGTQQSDQDCLNLMFISHVHDADDSTFSIDGDLGLSMNSEGREIHVVFT
jgi:hypothetical protein